MKWIHQDTRRRITKPSPVVLWQCVCPCNETVSSRIGCCLRAWSLTLLPRPGTWCPVWSMTGTAWTHVLAPADGLRNDYSTPISSAKAVEHEHALPQLHLSSYIYLSVLYWSTSQGIIQFHCIHGGRPGFVLGALPSKPEVDVPGHDAGSRPSGRLKEINSLMMITDLLTFSSTKCSERRKHISCVSLPTIFSFGGCSLSVKAFGRNGVVFLISEAQEVENWTWFGPLAWSFRHCTHKIVLTWRTMYASPVWKVPYVEGSCFTGSNSWKQREKHCPVPFQMAN